MSTMKYARAKLNSSSRSSSPSSTVSMMSCPRVVCSTGSANGVSTKPLTILPTM